MKILKEGKYPRDSFPTKFTCSSCETEFLAGDLEYEQRFSQNGKMELIYVRETKCPICKCSCVTFLKSTDPAYVDE